MNNGIAILIGLLAIAAAIYLRPTEFNQCVELTLSDWPEHFDSPNGAILADSCKGVN